MQHLIGGSAELGWVALKALLLYLTAVLAFRIGKRRTLAEMSPFDFVAAVAVGAIVGRLPTADASFVAGAITLVTVLLAHGMITWLRHSPRMARWIEHPPRLLVAHGKVLHRELRAAGLTQSDLYGLLRQRGVDELAEAHYVVFEQRGQVSVILHTDHDDTPPDLVRDIVARTRSTPQPLPSEPPSR